MLHEKIVTDHDGQAEILFLDRSSLSIGPDTETSVDDFAYSPTDGSGKLTANADKGLLRFSGGALSKRPDQVTLRTPIGILGVRGGIAIVEIDNAGGTTATFVYGNAPHPPTHNQPTSPSPHIYTSYPPSINITSVILHSPHSLTNPTKPFLNVTSHPSYLTITHQVPPTPHPPKTPSFTLRAPSHL